MSDETSNRASPQAPVYPSISVYQIEGNEDEIHLSIGGLHMLSVPANGARAVMLLKLQGTLSSSEAPPACPAPSACHEALEECLGQMGWTNYTDDELREEARLGNGKAPIILRARAALSAAPGPVACREALERVAKAIFETVECDPFYTWETLAADNPDRLDCLKQAKVAIAALSAARSSGEAIRLEARPADDGQEWTEIYPSQLEWVAKSGHQVRAIELTAPVASCSEAEVARHHYDHGYADGVEWATLHGSSEEMVAVPRIALDWLFGTAPDADGKWFSDCEDQATPMSAIFPRPKYWWRSKFRSMVPALSAGDGAELGMPSDDFINAFLKSEGSFVEAYEAPRESGVAVDMDMSQDDADAFNAEARNNFRVAWRAASQVTRPAGAAPVKPPKCQCGKPDNMSCYNPDCSRPA